MDTLGQRLRALRRGLGRTQYEAAVELAVPPSTYRKWEYGVRLPSVPSALRLAAWLGCSVEQLYRDLAPTPPQPAPMPGRGRGRPRKVVVS